MRPNASVQPITWPLLSSFAATAEALAGPNCRPPGRRRTMSDFRTSSRRGPALLAWTWMASTRLSWKSASNTAFCRSGSTHGSAATLTSPALPRAAIAAGSGTGAELGV